MLFAFHGLDRPDAAALRVELRPAHAEYQSAFGNPLGGPLLDEEGRPCGTLIVLDADDLTEAEERILADPYVSGGLFATWSLRAFHGVDWPTAG